ncbi:MAG TPA: hypothetical protein VIC55_05140 [Gemmatimonadaceae bacterium]|jgi:repressor LexA
MPESLTPVERKVYHYLLDFLTTNTYQPSVREIGRTFQIKSTKTVSEILQALARKGYIQRDPSRSRGVRLLGFQAAGRTIPVPPYVPLPNAPPDSASPNDGGGAYLTLDRRFIPNERVFYVKLSPGGCGDTALGILDGDYVLVDPGANASPGDLVIAHDGAQVSVRRADFPGATAHASVELVMLGTVCGVFRPFCEREDASAAEV